MVPGLFKTEHFPTSPPLFVTRASLGLARQAYYFDPISSHRFESKADKADFVEICFVPPAM
jgi:hypothetical protein